MAKYKTELHCHTAESSLKCGKVAAKDIVDMYVAAGYSTLLITDHYGGKHVSGNGHDYDIDLFLRGYTAAAEANGSINVILGIEVNLEDSANDYLLYGVTEAFIRQNPEMYKLSVEEFVSLAHENGMLVYQAHPFRDNMKVILPHICDGIEVFNAHPKHDSRNDIAMMWAEKYGLNKISGSDAHRPQGMALSGITTEFEIKNRQDLLTVLNNHKYELITY